MFSIRGGSSWVITQEELLNERQALLEQIESICQGGAGNLAEIQEDLDWIDSVLGSVSEPSKES